MLAVTPPQVRSHDRNTGRHRFAAQWSVDWTHRAVVSNERCSACQLSPEETRGRAADSPCSSSVRTGQAMTLTRWIIAARAWSSLSGASQNSEKIVRQAAGIASALANDHFGEAAVRNRAAVGSGSLLLKPSQLVSDLFRSSYADAYTLPAGGFAARAL